MHGMVRAVATVQAEDALGVSHEGAAGIDAEGHRPAFVQRCPEDFEILGGGVVGDDPVVADARRLEAALRQALREARVALARARRSAVGLVEVLNAGPGGEVRAASVGRQAGSALDVIVHVVLPTAQAAVGGDGARGREAARQHGLVAGEVEAGIAGLDAQAAVQRANGAEDPTAAAMPLVVDLADNIGALGPLLAGVEAGGEVCP
mmetsp:Transcript_115716/g.332396  ORF Transcript_115716/g.332396 Transcript_115716/m.332396 type:complete len:206 (+) Transcript_115716:714-1331(+)